MPDKQFLFSTDDYSINSIIANSQISYIHFRIPTFGSGYLFQGERSLTGKILSLKMSSVPYDLLGTGMKDGENLPPVASFTYSPQNPFANEEIIFDGSSSHDPDGQITQYKWNFGDGNSTEGIKLSHTYNKTRNYTVTLTVTDNDGLEDSLSKNIEVIKPPILLVYGWHGTVQNWDLIKQWLEKDGYIVEILEYDDSQHATIAAGTLSQKVNEMLVKYNTHKIDIIAHSFGGLVSRYYIEKMGGDEKVKNLVMIATPNHGSRLADYVTGEIDDNLGKNIAQFSLWLYALVRADKKWGSSLDLRTLNNNLFDLLNIGFDPNKLDTNYFVIAGTGHYPTKLSSHKMFLPGHDDGVVAVDSASLKTHGIPLYCTELDHSSIVNPYRVLERNYSDQLSRERLLKEVYNNVIKPILDGYSPPTSISPCPTTQDADDNQFLPNILDHIFIRLVPSESKDGNFDVSSSSSDIEIGITFHWCDFNFSLTSPTGREITPDIASKDENVEYFNNNSYWYYLIKNPEEGEWQYHIKAIEVPEEGTDIGISFIEYNFHFFNISLVKGWNLISIPLNLSNNSIKYIFNNTNLTIYSYKNNSFFVPKEINNELGYWIKVNTTSKLSLEGSSFKNAEINLSRGWNLIGYPSLDIKNVSAVFDNVSVVYAYNGTWRSYILNKTFNSLQTLKPGYGYWVKK